MSQGKQITRTAVCVRSRRRKREWEKEHDAGRHFEGEICSIINFPSKSGANAKLASSFAEEEKMYIFFCMSPRVTVPCTTVYVFYVL